MPLRHTLPHADRLSLPAAPMSTLTYDSVRALTELNDPLNADVYPWISRDGLRLYYVYDNGTSYGVRFAQRSSTAALFGPSTPLSIQVSNPISCWFSADELDAYVSDLLTLYYVHRNTTASPFGSPVALTLNGPLQPYITGATLNAAQTQLFIYTASVLGEVQEYTRTSATTFAYVRTLSAPLGFDMSPGNLSPDELSFFFGAFDLNTTGLTLIARLSRPTPVDSFAAATLQIVQGINDTSTNNFMPAMSDSLQWVVFARSPMNWEDNDMYIARLAGGTTGLADMAVPVPAATAYPNPATARTTICFGMGTPATVDLFDIRGRLISRHAVQSGATRLNLDFTGVDEGLYVATWSSPDNGKRISLRISVQHP